MMLTASNKENTIKKSVKIIDDDVHLSNVEKIIVRDFFPDLPKLETQVQYIEAMDRNNTQRLSELRSKVIKSTSDQYETPKPSAPETPVGKNFEEASLQTSDEAPSILPASGVLSKKEEEKIDKMSLNEYMGKYTSEDNANLVEMVEDTRQKKEAAKYGYQAKQLAIGASSKTKFWDYEQKSAVMYTPQGVELSAADLVELSQSKKQTIDLENTRFRAPVHTGNKPADLKHPPLHVEGKIGLDGKEIVPLSTPNVKGYRFMGTPSPAPGVDATPLMTWGEIDSTPFRLDGSETPVSGPSFKIPEMSKKDQILLELAGKVGREKKARKAEALKQAAKTLAGTPRSSMSTTERLHSMSPAAQRVATEKLRVHYDKFLHSPSPRRPTTPGTKTPTRTPKITIKTPTRTPTTPKVSIRRKDQSPLTDNLLKLPKHDQSHKFPKASDFF